jgi:fatty acid desaturase
MTAPAGKSPAVPRPRTRPRTTPHGYTSAYSVLSQRVRAEGLLRRRYGFYWAHMVGGATAFVLIWVGSVLVGDSWWQLLLAVALAVVCAQFGFLGHDAAHRQVFASHRWNEWAARLLSGVFAGLSYGWWIGKHNRHHAAPNQEGRDPDIAPGALAFTPAAVRGRGRAGRWLARRQGWLFFPLLMLEGVNLHVESVRTLLRPSSRPSHRGVEAVLVLGRLGGYVAALFLLLPPGKALAFLALQTAVFGVLLGAAFAPNHKGMPIVPATTRLDFLQRQVLTSRNIRGGLVVDAAMGGLNYQIEHHLFPSMPRPNLRRARPLVRAYCAEHGVPYTETGLFESYGIVVRHLNAVGIGSRDPFMCPLRTAYGR